MPRDQPLSVPADVSAVFGCVRGGRPILPSNDAGFLRMTGPLMISETFDVAHGFAVLITLIVSFRATALSKLST